MKKQIRYYPGKDLKEESYTYSDEKLAEVIFLRRTFGCAFCLIKIEQEPWKITY